MSYRVNYKTKKLFVTEKTNRFRKVVRLHWANAKEETFTGDVSVVIRVCALTHKRRDLDNLIKPTLDAMQLAGVFLDDTQVTNIFAHKCRCRNCDNRFMAIVTNSQTTLSVLNV